MSDLKTALHNAFNEAAPKAYGGYWQCATDDDTSGDHYDLNGSVNADRLATAITDHLFDRDRVRAALVEAMNGSAVRRQVTDYGDGLIHAYRRHHGGGLTREEVQDSYGAMFKADDLIDRLIAALTGGSQ